MTLRVGVVGLGMMGRHHVRVLSAMDDVELVGVCDPLGDPHRVAGHLTRTTDLDGLLALGVDAAVVATPTGDHLQVGLRLAAAGVHALIEKPLADEVGAACQLRDAFADAGLVLAVGHVERFNAAVRELKTRLSEGELGGIFQIATSRQGPFPDRVRDVGVIKDLATHDIDLTAWVAGARFRSVSARAAHRAGRRHEDLVAAVGMLDGGVVTNHLVNWLTPTKERRIVVTGERGAYIADTLTADLTFAANGRVASQWDRLSQFRGVSEGDVIRYALAKPEPLAVELRGFCDHVLSRDGEIVTGDEGIETLRVADAMARAAAGGTVEELA